MDNKKKSIRKKLIIALIVIGALLLLIGSFFLRDLLLRAGVTEYERGEILQVKEKYSAILTEITDAAADCEDFTVTVTKKGLFEKSLIEYDENSLPIRDKCGESVNILCHGYCWGISRRDGVTYFDFNKSGTKRLAYGTVSAAEGFACEELGDGWSYVWAENNGGE